MKLKYPFVHPTLTKEKIHGKKVIYTRSRATIILPYMIDKTFLVYNGKSYNPIEVNTKMLGYRLGEFVRTRKRGKDPRQKRRIV